MGASPAQMALTAVAFVVVSPVLGLTARRTTVETQGVVWYVRPLAATGLALLLASLLRPAHLRPVDAARGLSLGFGLLVLLRSSLWLLIARARRRGIGLRPTLVVANQSRIEQLEDRMATYPEAGLCFAAGYAPTLADDQAVEDGRAQAFSLLERDQVDHVLFVSDGISESVFREFIYPADCRKGYTLVLPLAHLSGRGTRHHLGDLGVLSLPVGASTKGLIAKRAFDVAVSAVLLALTAPILVVTAAAIWLHDRGPVIFRQQRIGRHNRPFVMLKFRSMVVDAEGQRDDYVGLNINTGLLFKLHDDPRVTPVGGLIRRLSIDELPQLINVLKGDMSLVGPRPLPVTADEFEEPARARHSVLPGITGPWQVEGGNALAYPDMVDLDLTYIATRSLGYDLQLLVRTVPALLNRRSAY
jgi:lipopolysaccharide/colanic/teichoic acid biosynthesis glycosyltransferase